MHLYYSLTSPYARLVRVALLEKGLGKHVTAHVVDPWADDADLMQANPAVRVPALVTDDGAALSESLLIIHYLEQARPEPSLVPAGRAAAVLAQTGLAFGIIDAAVQIMIGRRAAGAAFDTGAVGQRRLRAIHAALAKLEQALPGEPGPTLDLAAIALVVALDYLDLRFPAVNWAGGQPRLAAWREGLRQRPSLAETMPPSA